jgi:HSP20 family protein
MTTLVRWDPFSDFRRTVRLFDEGFARPRRFVAGEQQASFPIEVSETEQNFEVKASLPGIDPEKVEITVQNDVLTIRGEHREETEDTKREYYRRELRYGAFSRSLALPVAVNSEKAAAEFANGILTLHLPKAEANKPKQIKVTVGEVATSAGAAPENDGANVTEGQS